MALSSFAIADTLKLDRYDKLKLAELLARIPAEAKYEKSEKDESSSGLLKKWMIFPKEEGLGLKIQCEAHYYNNSPYISSADCLLDVDPNGAGVEHNYDEYRIQIRDEIHIQGLLAAIPHGQPRRELRSWQRDVGINFKGRKSEIFRYYFSCLETECEVLISEKGLN